MFRITMIEFCLGPISICNVFSLNMLLRDSAGPKPIKLGTVTE